MGEQQGALDGVRVLDFGQVIFGAACGQVLADHGATVIKIERPGSGDLSRVFTPLLGGESLPAISVNRGKRGLALDLKQPEGRAIALQLVATADVIIENFRPGVMEQLGLGYEQLAQINPRLVYASGSGYGPSGPLAETRRPGHELLAQSLTGLAWKNAVDGLPRALPTTVVDFTGAMLLAQGILLALLARVRTGRGQRVEVALADGALALQQWDLSARLNVPDQGGVDHHVSPLQAIYRTSDGFIAVVGWFRPNPVGNLCAALGLPDLSRDERFKSMDLLRANGDELRVILQAVFLTNTTDEWLAILGKRDILCGPVLPPGAYAGHEQARHQGMIVGLEQPSAGHVWTIASPVKLAMTAPPTPRPAPMVGEHSEEILHELGYSAAQVAALREAQVIGVPNVRP